MTTINCSLKCKHQHDGRCMLENAVSETLSAETDCTYFEERLDKGCSAFSDKKQADDSTVSGNNIINK